MSSSDNVLRPIKLRPGRSVLCPYDESVIHPQSSSVKLPAAGAATSAEGPTWATFSATSGVSTTYGSFTFTVAIDTVGNGSKPIVVGIVPRTFTAFDGKLGTTGWGVSSAGKAFNGGAKSTVAGLAFGAGDKVSVKVDCARPSVTFIIESKKTRKSFEHVMKVPSLVAAGWVVPAFSVASPGSLVSFETLTDTTPLDVFASRSADAEDLCSECDAFGSFFLRWWRRMNDNDTVKTSGGSLTKADLALRVVLFGSQTTPAWGRSPLPGVFDVDNTQKKMQALYAELCCAVSQDAAQAKKLGEMLQSPPEGLRMLMLRCSSPVAMGAMLAASAARATAPASPDFGTRVASPAASQKDTDVSDKVSSLQRRLEMLEKQVASQGNSSASPGGDPGLTVSAPSQARLTRTQSKAKQPVTTGRRGSVQPPAPSARLTAKRPVSKQMSRPTSKKHAAAAKPVSLKITTSNPVLGPVQKVRKLIEEVRIAGEQGSPSEEDLKHTAAMKERLVKEKAAAARDLGALDRDKAAKFVDDETKSEIEGLLETIVVQGDQHQGSTELVRSLLKNVPLDFASAIKDNNLAAMAAYDGSVEFLGLFLDVPEVSMDGVELVECALFNQTHRIPVTALLLDRWDQLKLAEVAEDIAEAWQEFFEDICSNERAKDREVRKGRLELVARLMTHKSPKVDPMAEGVDGQTCFSRGAREGDIDLMTTLLTTVPGAIDINHVSSADKTTALIQAVIKNQVTVVRALASLPNVDRSIACEQGTALSLAKSLKRDPEIVKVLSA